MNSKRNGKMESGLRGKAFVSILIIWLSTILLVFAATIGPGFSIPVFFEGGLYFVVLAACLFVPKLIPTFLSLDPFRKCFILLGIMAIIFSQLYREDRRTYPFAHWGMYSSASPSQSVIYFNAVHQSGREQQFPFHRISPSSSPRAFMAKIRNNYYRPFLHAKTGSDEKEKAELELRRILVELAGIYNQAHPDDPIMELSVGMALINPHGYSRPAELEFSDLVVVSLPREGGE